MIDPLWIAFAVLLIFDLLFAVVRASLVNARLPYLLNIKPHQGKPIERAIQILERPRLRISLRLSLILVHFPLAAVAWLLITRLTPTPPTVGQTIILLMAVGVLLLLIEYAIEGRSLRHPEEWAIHLAPLGWLIDLVFTPISLLYLAVLGYPDGQQKNLNLVTEDDLKNWVTEGQPSGDLRQGERRMIYSIFQFRNTLAREIMVPRIDVQALEIHHMLEEAISAMGATGHSRVPVFEETIDNIVGFLYAKDLIKVRREDGPLSEMRELLRPAYFVPEAKKVDELLTEMQARRVHVAIVVDEYGGVAGLVTLEDIMEEIVGEIQDEYDQFEEMLYQQVTPDEYIFQGRIELDNFNEVMGSHLPKENAETLGGFIYSEMGRVPAGGESFETRGLVLTVEQVTGRRIRKVRARRIHPSVEMKVEEANADE